jgi:esterase
MGGKLAMLYALTHPHRVRALCVVDAAPAAYGHSHQTLFQAMLAIDPARFSSRAQLQHALEDRGVSASDAAFALGNLREGVTPLQWASNVAVVAKDEANVHAWPLEDLAALHGRGSSPVPRRRDPRGW